MKNMSKNTENKFDINTIRLSRSLYIFAILLEVAVIGLGVFGAFTINNINANHIFTVSGFYLCLISFAEFSKLLSVEAMARYRSISLGLFASVAVLISIFLTAESLLNVASQLQHETIEDISDLNRQKVSDEAYIKNKEIKKIALIEKRLSYDAPQNIDNQEIIADELEDLDKANKEIEARIVEIRSTNNIFQKRDLAKEIISYEASIENLEDRLNVVQINYLEELQNIEETKQIQLNSTSRFQKDSVRGFFNNRVVELEKENRVNKTLINEEIKSFREKIRHSQAEIRKLNNLSEDSIVALEQQNEKIASNNERKKYLINQKDKIAYNFKQEKDVIGSEIKVIESEIAAADSRRLKNLDDIKRLKQQNWLFQLASVYYTKDVIQVTIEELKIFSFYFILLACAGLAILGPILIILSVNLERSVLKTEKGEKKHLVLFRILENTSSNILESAKAEYRFRKMQKHQDKEFKAAHKLILNEKREAKISHHKELAAAKKREKDLIKKLENKEKENRSIKARRQEKSGKELKFLMGKIAKLDQKLVAISNGESIRPRDRAGRFIAYAKKEETLPPKNQADLKIERLQIMNNFINKSLNLVLISSIAVLLSFLVKFFISN